MPLTNIKNTKADKKKNRGECAISSHEDYPYGLRIELNDEVLSKLGMKMPGVGEEMKVVAVGKVTSVSENQNERSRNRSVSIQLQKVEVKPTKKATAEDAVSEAVKDA